MRKKKASSLTVGIVLAFVSASIGFYYPGISSFFAFRRCGTNTKEWLEFTKHDPRFSTPGPTRFGPNPYCNDPRYRRNKPISPPVVSPKIDSAEP
jgi:hypothetical protein